MTSFLVAVTLVLSASNNVDSVQWHSDYGKALAATRADERPLLVVIDNSQDEKAAVDPTLLNNDKALAAYDLCHVDVSTEYGKRVAKVFGATKLPHTAIIDKTGSVILFKQAGKVPADTWANMLASYKSGERAAQAAPYTSNYRRPSTTVSQPAIGSSYQMGTPVISSPSYCPSCQRNAGNF